MPQRLSSTHTIIFRALNLMLSVKKDRRSEKFSVPWLGELKKLSPPPTQQELLSSLVYEV